MAITPTFYFVFTSSKHRTLLTSFHLTFVGQTALKNLFATVSKSNIQSSGKNKTGRSLEYFPVFLGQLNNCQRIVNLNLALQSNLVIISNVFPYWLLGCTCKRREK